MELKYMILNFIEIYDFNFIDKFYLKYMEC